MHTPLRSWILTLRKRTEEHVCPRSELSHLGQPSVLFRWFLIFSTVSSSETNINQRHSATQYETYVLTMSAPTPAAASGCEQWASTRGKPHRAIRACCATPASPSSLIQAHCCSHGMGVAEFGVPRDLAGPWKKLTSEWCTEPGKRCDAFLLSCSGIITCSVTVDGMRGP